MTKKVAREIIDTTPEKMRSGFAKGNPKKKNLFGFGKSKEKSGGIFGKKTTFSSKLSQQAYNLGYQGKDFDSWASSKKGLDRNLIDRLRAQHDKGWDAKHRDDARKHEATQKAQERKEEIQRRKEELEIRRLQHEQQTPPPLPGRRTFPVSDRGSHSARKGKGKSKTSPKRLSAASEDAGYGPYFNKLSAEDKAKVREYLKTHPAKKNIKNPNWSLTQGTAKAFVFQLKTGTYEADVIRPGAQMETQTFSGPHPFRSATSWARLRLHEVANPHGCKVKIFKRGNAKRNPIDKAEKAYEEFHGIPSKEVLEYQEQFHHHSVVMGIGPLISMQVQNVQGTKTVEIFAPDPEQAKLGDVVMLTCSEDGRQFIAVGGDQKLKLGALESFGITEQDVRDHMLIGTIVQLTYRTKKSFEKHGKEEVDFFHDLGGEGSRGVCPVLVYKPRNPSIEIAGGRYQIAKPEGSLGGVSPGIVG